MPKIKILLDATLLAVAETQPTARTGIFFVITNLCRELVTRDDVELGFYVQGEQGLLQALNHGYENTIFNSCLDISGFKIGSERIIFISPWHCASNKLLDVPNSIVFQIIYDLAFHVCPEQIELVSEFKKHHFQLQERLINFIADGGHALCISHCTCKDLIKLSGCPEDRVGFFYPGLKKEISDRITNAEIESPRIKTFLDMPDGAKYVLVLSTVVPHKNIETTLKVFSEIVKSSLCPDLHLVIVGSLYSWDNAPAELESLPVEVREKIRLTGYVPDNFLPGLYKGALCLLFPSFYEGFGMPLVEAMAFGTPVVTSNRGSIPEVVGDAVETYDAYDYEGMAEKIMLWYLNPEKRRQDGVRAYERSKYFTWDKAVDSIVKFIKEKSDNLNTTRQD